MSFSPPNKKGVPTVTSNTPQFAIARVILNFTYFLFHLCLLIIPFQIF